MHETPRAGARSDLDFQTISACLGTDNTVLLSLSLPFFLSMIPVLPSSFPRISKFHLRRESAESLHNGGHIGLISPGDFSHRSGFPLI